MNYTAVLETIATPVEPANVGAALLDVISTYYLSRHKVGALVQFEQSGATYLFDLASSIGIDREDRTVVAWNVTPRNVSRLDVAYQRGYPMLSQPGETVDRGHLIPHLSGGEFGPNIFRQDRALNRGWSVEGRRYRAIEREAASTPGCFYFGHLIYDDETAYPAEVEIGLLRAGVLHVERFVNRSFS
jgi:hypothetical protein